MVQRISRGIPGHFARAGNLGFSICTDIGPFRISSVGMYRPMGTYDKVSGGGYFDSRVFEIGTDDDVDYSRCLTGAVVIDEPSPQSVLRAEDNHEMLCRLYADVQRIGAHGIKVKRIETFRFDVIATNGARLGYETTRRDAHMLRDYYLTLWNHAKLPDDDRAYEKLKKRYKLVGDDQ